MDGPTNVLVGNSQNYTFTSVKHLVHTPGLFAWGSNHLIINGLDQIAYPLHKRHAPENLARKYNPKLLLQNYYKNSQKGVICKDDWMKEM